jgi:Cysteine synthase
LPNNGYGEHNIQGIGDKHVPLIHNVMNTDFVVGISDQATNNLNLMFNTEIGKKFLISKKGFDNNFVNRLPEFGFSTIANILASIKLAQYMNLGSNDAIITVATDGADLYLSELQKTKDDFKGMYDETACSEIYGQYLKGISTDNTLELNQRERERIFNLGYYTWVEQQGIDVNEFEKRRDQNFWNEHHNYMLSLDNQIKEFNNI